MKTKAAYILVAIAANIAMLAAPYESLASKVGFWLFIAITVHQAVRAFVDVAGLLQNTLIPYGMECATLTYSKPGWYVLQFMVLFILAVNSPSITVVAWAWFSIAAVRLSLHIRSLEVKF
jgi:hypothetical protein